ncbi:putative G-protein coupled receptor 158 [Larimichthys crocea]|uniref:Uncharacterized protein n=1 Tax=Larimichthys crocea TaxID=215358 RepID=A0ACD3QPJ8_LARCR|nr:putative G-protein coupled receptor 158 [Larimichthys crocea]
MILKLGANTSCGYIYETKLVIIRTPAKVTFKKDPSVLQTNWACAMSRPPTSEGEIKGRGHEAASSPGAFCLIFPVPSSVPADLNVRQRVAQRLPGLKSFYRALLLEHYLDISCNLAGEFWCPWSENAAGSMYLILTAHIRSAQRSLFAELSAVTSVSVGAPDDDVGILYFQPSVFRCILLRWVRLLGFATVYGTLTLKLYRVLKVFLSRTAQRIPYMTSWRVLRLLGIILLIVCWFLVAWTSAVCQNPDRKLALIDVGYTPNGLQFSMCLLDRWDYMMAVAEFLFLLWAVYLCYAVRTVPSAFHEPRYMAIAVHNELVLSAIFYVIRFTLAPELHPDWMLLLFFTHTHLTVTVTLGLLLIPKFLFAGTHMRDDIASEAYEDELDMGRSGSYLNSSITSAWSEHSLDPEDIREELKKLYSQLEIYKRKKMLANNPHLQKKRSSKKGLGRSLMRRITEIP